MRDEQSYQAALNRESSRQRQLRRQKERDRQIPPAQVVDYNPELGAYRLRLVDGSLVYAQSDTNGAINPSSVIQFKPTQGRDRVDGLPCVRVEEPIVPASVTEPRNLLLFSRFEWLYGRRPQDFNFQTNTTIFRNYPQVNYDFFERIFDRFAKNNKVYIPAFASLNNTIFKTPNSTDLNLQFDVAFRLFNSRGFEVIPIAAGDEDKVNGLFIWMTGSTHPDLTKIWQRNTVMTTFAALNFSYPKVVKKLGIKTETEMLPSITHRWNSAENALGQGLNGLIVLPDTEYRNVDDVSTTPDNRLRESPYLTGVKNNQVVMRSNTTNNPTVVLF